MKPAYSLVEREVSFSPSLPGYDTVGKLVAELTSHPFDNYWNSILATSLAQSQLLYVNEP